MLGEYNKPIEQTDAIKIHKITTSLNSLLQAKNRNYGSSALSPLGVFNKNSSNILSHMGRFQVFIEF